LELKQFIKATHAAAFGIQLKNPAYFGQELKQAAKALSQALMHALSVEMQRLEIQIPKVLAHCCWQAVIAIADCDNMIVPRIRTARNPKREIAFLYIDIKILNFLVTSL